MTLQLFPCGKVTETVPGKYFQMKYFDIQAITCQEKNNNTLFKRAELQGHQYPPAVL